MSEQLTLRIEPKDAVDSSEAESLQVRINYHVLNPASESEPSTHQASELVRLNRHAHADVIISPICLKQPVTAFLENRQGLEIANLGTIETIPATDGEPVKLIITTAVLKQALARKEPEEQPVFERSGRSEERRVGKGCRSRRSM